MRLNEVRSRVTADSLVLQVRVKAGRASSPHLRLSGRFSQRVPAHVSVPQSNVRESEHSFGELVKRLVTAQRASVNQRTESGVKRSWRGHLEFEVIPNPIWRLTNRKLYFALPRMICFNSANDKSAVRG
jgi:hypothetical protein